MLATLQQFWMIKVFNYSEGMQSQDVKLCLTLYKKGKLTALSKLQQGDFPELYSVVGEETATHEDLMRIEHYFLAALYGQPKCSSMNTAQYMIYIKKKGKAPLVYRCLPLMKICSCTCCEHILKH